jgi:hypothetical protein
VYIYAAAVAIVSTGRRHWYTWRWRCCLSSRDCY